MFTVCLLIISFIVLVISSESNGSSSDDRHSSHNNVRRRHQHDWGQNYLNPSNNRQSDSAENQKRLEEIMKQTGILRLNGKVRFKFSKTFTERKKTKV